MKLFFDGGLRPMGRAGAGMEWAVVIRGEAVMAHALGAGTSMEAEWLALNAAVRLAHERGIADPVLVGDAAAVIAQARGRARCPPALHRHLTTFRAAGGEAMRLRHVRRSQNLAGIALDALRR